MPDSVKSLPQMPPEAAEIGRQLLQSMSGAVVRADFLHTLAEALHPVCCFSWLTISIKDEEDQEMFADFSSTEQRFYNPCSVSYPQSLTLTMAEYCQDTVEILVVADCKQYFSEIYSHPVFSHNVTAAIAWPLSLNNVVFATLNLGYEDKPGDLDHIASFVSQLCPTVSTCLAVVLSKDSSTIVRSEKAEVVDETVLSLDVQLNSDFVLRSQAMREVMRQVAVLTNLDIPVLLLGETGTGKSMIARHIHKRSLRARYGQFVRVNCPSLASGLFESEMFGHAKGSFTGATKKRTGRFELAHKGTLFLDEVAELSMDMQSKLLQVLDDSSFERVGESEPLMIDMRIVAATNVHIGEALSQGRLRGDLFHRISVFTIELPPLRERSEDISPLAMNLSGKSSEKLGLPDVAYTQTILSTLSEYHWPGNTRELSNLMTRLVIAQNVHGCLSLPLVKEAIDQSESFFLAESSPNRPGPAVEEKVPQLPSPISHNLEEEPEDMSLAGMERNHILKVLAQTGGVISGPKGAARILGLPRSTLLHRMSKLGLVPSDK